MNTVKEFVPTDPRTVVDSEGDISFRGNYSEDQYPDVPSHIVGELKTIELYEDHLHFDALVKKGSRNNELRKEGGIKACRKKKIDALLAARRAYLHSQGIDQIDLSESKPLTSQQINDYYAGVILWGTYSISVLENDTVRHERLAQLDRQKQIWECSA